MKLEELAMTYMVLLKQPVVNRAEPDFQRALCLLRDEIADHMQFFTPREIQDAFERKARNIP